ncbi:hypothetical protein RN001_003970 [Aquatica leii]|uniref:Nucleoporin 58 n=1 Tax=Aquatica leii TaxID=1421715 RepID=A0AAN7SMK6_9COLE|nr:hypothetical protein RN001_003970 [Aquatica leii]
MSSGFSFSQKPNEPPTFGQASFGAPQFGTPAATTAQQQFSLPFGGKPTTGGFQFSTPVSTSAFGGGGLNFTATNTQQNANPNVPTFGLNATTAPAFSLNTTSTGFAYSTPSTMPQMSALFGSVAPSTPGLALGTAKTNVPAFGTSGGLFGTMASTAPATQTTGFPMSGSMPASTALSFGTPQSTAPKMSYGSSTTPGGFSFAPTPATSTGPSAGVSFGAKLQTPATTKYSFGPAATSAAPALYYGAVQSTPATSMSYQPPSTSVPQIGLTFPTPTSATPQITQTFGAPASTAPNLGLSFGTPTLAATKPALNTSFPTISTPTTTLNFMAPAATAPSLSLPTVATSAAPLPTITPTTGLSFLPTTSVPASTSISFGLPAVSVPATTAPAAPTVSFAPTINFGATAATTAPVLNFGSTLATTSANTSITTTFGLGGVKPTPVTSSLTGFTAPTHTLGGTPKTTDISTTKLGADQTEVAPKDQVLPNELMQTVENFKKFMKEQKSYSSEIARFSIKDLRKVEHDVDVINNCMNEVENQLRKNKAIADKLKMDTAKDLQNAEMAQRTFDTPAGLQYENTAPFNYFVELSDNFEKEMHDLKMHIENVAKYIRNSGAPTTLSPEDLALGMRRLHESFVALAGRLQSVHSQVELQKEQYLGLRKKMLNDYTNVFEKKSKESDALEILLEKLAKQQPTISNSPTPFTSLRSSQVQAVGQNSTSGYPTVTTMGPSVTSGFSIGAAPNMSLFGTNTTTIPSLFNTSVSSSFQLQKPPVGNKRGKP